ncbi:hypothetical protein [Geodermatophilus sp. CPCC 206100]|uniref:hypothetical protein n=1 Tax=Geodermatophilus sp. CPCC 206100 TaxID=3020054 RepID=UPI003B00D1A7
MSAQRDDVRAAELYVADLEPHPGGRVQRTLRVAGAFLSELVSGLLPAPTVSDVVVRRRADGAEALRVPAADPVLPGDLLRFVREQLDSMDAEAFLAEWGEPA